MRKATWLGVLVGMGVLGMGAMAADVPPDRTPAPPTVPADVQGKDGVKAYLLAVVDSITSATRDFKTAATEYDQLVQASGSAQAAARAHPADVARLIRTLRDAYQRIDSYGYEYIEGIVAGVPSLMHYDVELDSGLPKREAASPQDQIADLVLHADGLTIDHEGSLNNYLIEPTVYGTHERFTVGKAPLPGFSGDVGLPNPKLTLALADYALDAYARLQKDARAWQPTEKDCFHVLYNMTPTLADYFDEWKESKKNGGAPGGRFVAVSRVSDMRGIMSSVRLTWEGIQSSVKAKDAPLADSVSRGYAQIIHFIDTIDARDAQKPLNIETIDALGSQAKEKADKLTVQTAQAAALMGIDVNAQ